ncbi:MAG TPA: hypothetical protein DCF84_00455 [Bacteroidetes bacterium]|nr:hypothetical protein [Bacteroidota bacterium]
MKDLPKISFIIPFYNAGDTLKETLSSVVALEYPTIEIIVVNDGSTCDTSVQTLRDAQAHFELTIINIDNSGPSIARNIGIERSTGKFIIPLDADDLIEGDCHLQALKILEEDPRVGAVVGRTRFFGKKSGSHLSINKGIDAQLIYNQFPVTAIIRKSMIDDVGLYDPELSKPGLEDWEFWIRVVASKTWNITCINSPFLAVRVSEHSRTILSANPNKRDIDRYIHKKHAILYAQQHERLFYALQGLYKERSYKIGRAILAPLRWIKHSFYKPS